MRRMDDDRSVDLRPRNSGKEETAIAAARSAHGIRGQVFTSIGPDHGDTARRDPKPVSLSKPSPGMRLTHAAKLRRAARFPATIDELVNAARRSSVPVTKCPPGVHSGWRPRWL